MIRFAKPAERRVCGVLVRCLVGGGLVIWLLGVGLATPARAQTAFDPYASPGHTYPNSTSGSLWSSSPLNLSLPSLLAAPASLAPTASYADTDGWLPPGHLFTEFLADEKAPRLSVLFLKSQHDSNLLDGTLGGRFALFRSGPRAPIPGTQAFELGIEGASLFRVDLGSNFDLRSADFRAGVPLAFRSGPLYSRFGYYHLSSHLGDEFLLKNPTFQRLNWSRDALFFGLALQLNELHRVYGETSWAFNGDFSEPWDFKFGIERAPIYPTGTAGAPFWALHGHLREEVDFGGHFTAQAGWAWRGSASPGLFRIGLHYFNGKSLQYSFFNQHEQQFGLGLWYDF